jgi:hypothetical protein
MLYALDENGSKIKASPNAKGFCPISGGELIPRCGEIYAWHWANKAGQGDPWRSGESEWHRLWKMRFMESWQEVVVIKYEEKHIANVKTPRCVIEFESDTPSTEMMQCKEQFFGEMVWVAKADDFINRMIRKIDGSYIWQHPRKSWTFTRKPLYFDSGKHLYRVTFLGSNGGTLRLKQITYIDFIKLTGGEELI